MPLEFLISAEDYTPTMVDYIKQFLDTLNIMMLWCGRETLQLYVALSFHGYIEKPEMVKDRSTI